MFRAVWPWSNCGLSICRRFDWQPSSMLRRSSCHRFAVPKRLVEVTLIDSRLLYSTGGGYSVNLNRPASSLTRLICDLWISTTYLLTKFVLQIIVIRAVRDWLQQYSTDNGCSYVVSKTIRNMSQN